MRILNSHSHIHPPHNNNSYFVNFVVTPAGFEDVIQVHFAIQREAIMKQLSQWVKEVISSEHERKLRKAIDEFRAELDKI